MGILWWYNKKNFYWHFIVVGTFVGARRNKTYIEDNVYRKWRRNSSTPSPFETAKKESMQKTIQCAKLEEKSKNYQLKRLETIKKKKNKNQCIFVVRNNKRYLLLNIKPLSTTSNVKTGERVSVKSGCTSQNERVNCANKWLDWKRLMWTDHNWNETLR